MYPSARTICVFCFRLEFLSFTGESGFEMRHEDTADFLTENLADVVSDNLILIEAKPIAVSGVAELIAAIAVEV